MALTGLTGYDSSFSTPVNVALLRLTSSIAGRLIANPPGLPGAGRPNSRARHRRWSCGERPWTAQVPGRSEIPHDGAHNRESSASFNCRRFPELSLRSLCSSPLGNLNRGRSQRCCSEECLEDEVELASRGVLKDR